MIRSGTLYSDNFQEYSLKGEKLERLHKELLAMLLDVKAVCDKNGIDYMLYAGSLIGAIRHKGFIPWDDDIDLMMLRKEAMRFIKCFREEFPDKYVIYEPLDSSTYIYKMIKIYKKGTTFIEVPFSGVPGPNMLFLDVFLIENVPASPFVRKIKGKVYETAFRAASLCVDYKYPSDLIMSKFDQSEDLKKYYNYRRRWGRFFNFFGGMKFYIKICEKLGNQKKVTGYMSLVSDFSYGWLTFPSKMYEEVIETDFEGYQIKIPKDYDGFLTCLYGDYMTIPEESKRRYHVAYKVDFGDK
ncbi:MAG: LicD family protein [Clostridiales bacterium]|nr:LicD family protein [Clostridiales bacterium]